MVLSICPKPFLASVLGKIAVCLTWVKQDTFFLSIIVILRNSLTSFSDYVFKFNLKPAHKMENSSPVKVCQLWFTTGIASCTTQYYVNLGWCVHMHRYIWYPSERQLPMPSAGWSIWRAHKGQNYVTFLWLQPGRQWKFDITAQGWMFSRCLLHVSDSVSAAEDTAERAESQLAKSPAAPVDFPLLQKESPPWDMKIISMETVLLMSPYLEQCYNWLSWKWLALIILQSLFFQSLKRVLQNNKNLNLRVLSEVCIIPVYSRERKAQEREKTRQGLYRMASEEKTIGKTTVLQRPAMIKEEGWEGQRISALKAFER